MQFTRNLEVKFDVPEADAIREQFKTAATYGSGNEITIGEHSATRTGEGTNASPYVWELPLLSLSIKLKSGDKQDEVTDILTNMLLDRAVQDHIDPEIVEGHYQAALRKLAPQ